MNKLTNGSSFPGEAMDTRQAPARHNPKTAISSGVVNEWFRLPNVGTSSAPKRFTSEQEMTGRFSTYHTRQVMDIFTTNGQYEKTRQDVTSLLYAEEDEDFARPTQYALDLALNLLEDANAKLITLGAKFPRGASSTSDKGGIYVFWEENGQSVQLEVPSKEGEMFYIHITSPGKSLMNKNVSAITLADALAAAHPSGRRRLGTKNAPASSAA